jgi:lipoate---protein ligase
MQLLDKTFPSAEENLALDEALLESAEAGEINVEVLRLWEPDFHFVVAGRSSPIDEEIDVTYCEKNSIPILRRVSGGASVVAGPGCLMYAVLLSYEIHPELRMLDQAHRFVINKMAAATRSSGKDVEFKGTCDLTIGNRKFSGNSLRCKRSWFLYHGTILYGFDLSLISRCLKKPSRQPDYRHQREHGEFVTNLMVSARVIRSAIGITWCANEEFDAIPTPRIVQLVDQKYSRKSWTNCR